MHRQPLIVDDVKQDDRYYQSIAKAFKFKVASLLCVPLLSHQRLIGVLQVVRSRSRHYFNADDQGLLMTFASEAAIAIENARLYENLKEERDKIVAVEDEVRKNLARDLHDGPTQYLVGVIINLELVKELIKVDPQEALPEIEQTMAVANTALVQLRSLLFDLRPVILETQGLVPALELYTERLQDTENLNISLSVEQDFSRLSHKAEVAIFAIVQEAVSNAKKYAQASRLDIVLQPDMAKDRLLVVIKDNGVGFNIETTEADYDTRGSLGMLNMRERAASVNGELKLSSTSGKGTRIELQLPLYENYLSSTVT
jgi:signal transduction histidine kinase